MNPESGCTVRSQNRPRAPNRRRRAGGPAYDRPMTSVDAARSGLDQAQTLLDRVTADNQRFDEVLGWLAEARERANQLDEYYRGPGQDHVATVLAADPEAVTPPVANEDAAWEALADSHDRLLRLLKLVTEELTSGMDD